MGANEGDGAHGNVAPAVVDPPAGESDLHHSSSTGADTEVEPAQPTQLECETEVAAEPSREKRPPQDRSTQANARRKAWVQRQLDDFVATTIASGDYSSSMSLPPTLNSFERKVAHELAGERGLDHASTGPPSARIIVVTIPEGWTPPTEAAAAAAAAEADADAPPATEEAPPLVEVQAPGTTDAPPAGSHVVLEDLSKAELNGLIGKCGELNESGRVLVTLPDERVLALKHANVRMVPADGTQVVLQNLSKAELNGRTGMVKGELNEKDRLLIALDDGRECVGQLLASPPCSWLALAGVLCTHAVRRLLDRGRRLTHSGYTALIPAT